MKPSLVGYGVLNCSTLHNDNVKENIIQKFKKTLAMEIGYPKDRKGLLIRISFVTMYCALLYKDRLTEFFPAYMVLNFQKVIKRLE